MVKFIISIKKADNWSISMVKVLPRKGRNAKVKLDERSNVLAAHILDIEIIARCTTKPE
jgi:hypothetical protein